MAPRRPRNPSGGKQRTAGGPLFRPGRLFAGYFEPGEVGELIGAMAGGHGDVGETFVVELGGNILAFGAFGKFGIYIQRDIARQ